MTYDITNKTVWIAGSTGMVGQALVKRLDTENCRILRTTRQDLDCTRQNAVEEWMTANRPDAVVIAAARVGGIMANQNEPAQFIFENLAIAQNIIHSSWLNSIEKLLFLGSSCIYPKFSEIPIKEESLLSGTLEQSNEPYAIAKIAGIKLCQAYMRQYGCRFISVMPCNLYGPGDLYDDARSHVIPALIQRFHKAKINRSTEVTIWGTGHPRREFLYIDDLADALVFLLKNYEDEIQINVGTGEDIPILELAHTIANIVGFEGEIKTDPSRPDGTYRKVMDNGRLKNMGWQPQISLEQGLSQTYDSFLRIMSRYKD